MENNYYKLLGVSPTATEAEIKQAYRLKAKLLHPDHNNNNEAAAEKLIVINQAYAVLSNKTERAKYDRQNQQQQQPRGGQQQYSYGGGGHQGGNHNVTIEQMTANAYNTGYSKGYSDSTSASSKKEAMFGKQIEQLQERLRTCEVERSASARRLHDLEDQVGELEAENSTLWIQVGEDSESNKGSEKDAEYKKIIDGLNAKIKEMGEEYSALEEKSKVVEAVIFEKELEINNLTEENNALNAQIDSYEQYLNSKENEENMDSLISEREHKMKQVKKMIKNTYYGILGVVYWADNTSIFKSYEKLTKRFQAKYDSGDYKAKTRLNEIENAYNTLIDTKARKSYNKTIDITDEDIRMERLEEKEYNATLEKYKGAQDEDAFWEYVDDLMFQSQTGEADAQNELGELYLYGEDIEQDLDQAFYWFKEAAKQNHPEGLLNLGKCYLKGDGTLRDEEKGISFIKKAARLGNKEAQAFAGKK